MTKMKHLLLPAAALALASCGEVSQQEFDKVESHRSTLQREVYDHQRTIQDLQRQLEVEKGTRERSDAESKEIRQKFEELRKERDTLKRDFDDYKRTFQLSSRVSAVGEKAAEMKTADGKTYREVLVKAVLGSTIVFSHAEGTARLPLSTMTDDWKKRFDFREDVPCVVSDDDLQRACTKAFADVKRQN